MRHVARTILALIIAAGILASFLPSRGAFADGGGDEITCETGVPSFFYDFRNGDFQCFSSFINIEAEDTGEGVLIKALADDPNTTIEPPTGMCKDLAYMSVTFRSQFKIKTRYAEFYYTTESRAIDEKYKNIWTWDVSNGEWVTQSVELKNWKDLDEELVVLRFDPIASNSVVAVAADEQIEIASIAFFPSKDEADSFDADKYRAYLTALNEQKQNKDWNTSEVKELKPLAADNAEGTLKISNASNGKYEMSYMLNGKEVKYTLPDSAFYRNGPLAGTDDVGRTIVNQFAAVKPDYTTLDEEGGAVLVETDERTVGVYGENGEHYVGIFYFLWLGQNSIKKNKNIEQIVSEYGNEAKKVDLKEWGSVYDIFFFAEPLYGYYASTDEWVVRKHMELLTNAGVDFLYFDTTNNYIYDNVVKIIQKVCHEMNEQGIKAPKIVFYTNTDAKTRVKQIYNAIYRKGEYQDTWLYLDVKPLIIAPEDCNIDGFFSIREPQWPNEPKRDNTWPWIDWQWPQELYGHADDQLEAISVSVAQHSGNGEFSSSGLYGYTGNRGRSYDGTRDNLTDDSYKLGLNIQRQFNYAYNVGSKYVLVTGWNEWIASRQEPTSKKTPVKFIDTFNYEYSRDMEMSKGGYFDNYYMQLVSNAAMIKGAVPGILRDDRHLINVTGDFSQWDAVKHVYTDVIGDNAERNSRGSMIGTRYTDKTGRNDIVSVKVTNDATYLHFLVECAEDIVRTGEDSSWLQIMLDVDSSASTGWLGYDFIANNNVTDGSTSTLGAYSGTGGEYKFTDKANLTYKVEGKKMMVSIPLEELGIEYITKIDLQFKVCDSETRYTSAEQFYLEGDCAPVGRPNFVYGTYFPRVSEVNLIRTVKVADRAAKLLNDDSMESAGIEKPEIPDADKPSAGCGGCGSAGGGIAAFGASALAVVILRKRKENY